ncbi:MAG: type II toxin-antitoxin system RelE/ParE family toxin [Myxococcaceae bacterium]
MAAKLRVLRAAAGDARAAWRWYRERDPEAADVFLAEYDAALQRIADAPDRWPAFVAGTRRCLLHRFPYSVVYRVGAEFVDVVAVAHQRRRPGFWRAR